jgi:DNA-binding CsgD family transcriptional regulator
MTPIDRIARLTERQRECLRLIGSGLQMKEIALRLGVKPDAIRERLRAAREVLDVDRSLTAARLLAEWEARDVLHPNPALHGTYTQHVEPQKVVVPGTDPAPVAAVAERSARDRDLGSILQERQTAFEYDRPPPVIPITQAPGSPLDRLRRRRPNDRDTGQRIISILLMAILLVILFWGGTAVFVYLSRALTDIAKHGG